MSLHLRLFQDKKDLNSKIKIISKFFNIFNNQITLFDYSIKCEGTIIENNKIENLNVLFDRLLKEVKFDKDYSIEFFFKFENDLAYLQINKEYYSNFSGDLEIDLLSESFSKILNNPLIKEKLDSFLISLSKEKKLIKAYVDINDEGEENPLNIIYEYEPQGSNFLMRVMKVLELMSDEDDNLYELFLKINGSNKNLVANRLWDDFRIRKKIFKMAEDRGLVVQEGSFLMFAQNEQGVKDYYLDLINNIISPIFNDVPSIEVQIDKFSQTLEHTL